MNTLYLQLLLVNQLCFTIRCEHLCLILHHKFEYVYFLSRQENHTMFKYSGCRKGDYYRYLAEFKSGNEKKEAADQSMKAYEV